MNHSFYGKSLVREKELSGNGDYSLKIRLNFKIILFWKDHLIRTLGVTENQAMKIIKDNISDIPEWIEK